LIDSRTDSTVCYGAIGGNRSSYRAAYDWSEIKSKAATANCMYSYAVQSKSIFSSNEGFSKLFFQWLSILNQNFVHILCVHVCAKLHISGICVIC